MAGAPNSRPVDPSEQIPLAPQALEILLALGEGPLHGYGIVQSVEARIRGEWQVGTSTLYATLRRLRQVGLVEDVPDPEPDASGGPARRFYRITPFGSEVGRLEALRLRNAARIAAARFAAEAPAPQPGGADV